MPVERVDVQIQAIISDASQKAQKALDKDEEADHARKVADKKIALKKEELKSSNQRQEVFRKHDAVNQRMRQILGGAAGPDAANALGQWQNNAQLQAKLTEAQRQLFFEAMAKNPAKATQAAQAMNRLSEQPGFSKAVNSAPLAGTVLGGVLEHPAHEKPLSALLQSRFMQGPKSDPQTKNQFLRFGLQQAAKNRMDSVKLAGDMLGVLSKNGLARGTQRAAMSMVQRRPDDARAVSDVDRFVQQPNVSKLPWFARSKATEILARANARPEVREGFEHLIAHPKYRQQTAQNKGRFFATLGTGRPSEFRALTDKTLLALQNPAFPTRAGQVGKFLSKMAVQIQQDGAKGVNPDALIRSAKGSDLPAAPQLLSTANLEPEDASKVRAQNRAKIIQFYNQLQRIYERGEKKLHAAKYLEDVNALHNLREGPALEISALSSEDQAFVQAREAAVRTKLDEVRNLFRQRSRELRTKRIPPAKRRAMLAHRRVQGRQPRYFTPGIQRERASEAFLRAAANGSPTQSLAPSPRRHHLSQVEARARLGDSIQEHVSLAMTHVGSGPITPQQAGQVARAIAAEVAQQVAQQVSEQLLGANAGQVPTAPAALLPKEDSGIHRHIQTGKVDAWGIPRSFERDLGATQHQPVKAATPEAAPTPSHQAAAETEEKLSRLLVKDPASIRELSQLFVTRWKQLTKSETALLRNLGWSQQSWDTKDTPAARWPATMGTLFANLNATQKESVRKLGLTTESWNLRVQALGKGKNA